MNEESLNAKGAIKPLLTGGLDEFLDLPVRIHAELGRTRLRIKEFLRLEPLSIVELPASEGEYIGIYVNGRLVARGEIIVVEGTMAVRIAEIVNFTGT